ncbi:MAG: DMT family transporter [Gammaproteobacteria bacterium]
MSLARRSPFWSTAAIVVSTFVWGTWWIPLRQLDALGVSGLWATSAAFFLPLVVLLPLGLIRWRSLLQGGRVLLWAGLLIALSTSLYAEGMVRGYVARVLLLFHLAPVWSVLLGRWLLSEPITARRIATVCLGLCGMFVIFGINNEIPYPHTVADWMGLLSGASWAVGIVLLRRIEATPVIDKTIAIFLFMGLAFVLLTMIPGGRQWSGMPGGLLLPAMMWLLGLAAIWIFPIAWLTSYGASGIDPGRVSILLMLEVVIGLTTAALLTDEPFGLREIAGAALIVAAGLTELSTKQSESSAPVRATVD